MRARWPKTVESIPARNLVFLDESSANTSLARLRGWWLKGERLRSFVPCGRWHTTTMLCAIRSEGAFAPLILDGAMDGESFLAYVEQILLPALRPEDVVVMDNLSTHKTEAVAKAFLKKNVRVLYLPPYSPDLNPIENMWSKVKAVIRQHAARNLSALMYAMAEALETITESDCLGYFKNAGYKFHKLS
jgi:Transposase and inactivated derivatives